MHGRIARKRVRAAVLVAVLGALVASGPDASSMSVPPRRKGALLSWLKAGTYQSTFTPEPEPHASAAAHGPYVRTWYSPVLVEDLAAGRSTFRKGAAMVKEFYLRGPDEPPVGYSVMRKLRSRSGPTGRGWLFYEAFDGSNASALFGRGLGACTGCHQTGVDYLRSEFRP